MIAVNLFQHECNELKGECGFMDNYQVRTDLALEAKESISKSDSSLTGVKVEEYYRKAEDVYVTKVVIESKNAAKIMGKATGTYITMEAPGLIEPDEGYHREISQCIADELGKLVPNIKEEKSCLVVGLGNRDVTADSLGPHVIDNLLITRHILKEYGTAAYDGKRMNFISSMEPGVMARTGMETAEILKGIVNETKPDLVVVIDALAARSTKRLNKTIQISDTGIQPGSGVGNHRDALTKESLGVDVIALGVPTVVDAATIVADAFERLLMDEGSMDEKIKYIWQKQNVFPELNNMYMTGKDVDAIIKRISYTISEGLNIALTQIE